MDLNKSLFIMILGSFIIQFFLMSTLMTNKLLNIRASIGKFYISIIMASLMGFLEVVMYDYHMGSISIVYYLSLILVIILFNLNLLMIMMIWYNLLFGLFLILYEIAINNYILIILINLLVIFCNKIETLINRL